MVRCTKVRNDDHRGWLTRGFDRAFFWVADLVTKYCHLDRSPSLDVTLLLERLESDERREVLIALDALTEHRSGHTARAGAKVQALTKHDDPEIAAAARRCYSHLVTRFGPDVGNTSSQP